MADQDTYGLAKTGMSGGEDSKPAKVIHHINIRKAKGGHIVEHHHTRPEHHPMEEHTTGGTDGLMSHVLDHMTDPNPGEAEADAGQSGINTAAAPPTGASPAGAAMPTTGA